MAGKLSPSQRDVAGRALKQARRKGATARERKALIEAGLVESQLTHLKGGDRDSTGFLQQRPSQGWGPVGESVERDTAQFLKEARKYRGQPMSAGALAQRVQRSAFPERYGQRGREADHILRALGSGAPGPAPAPTGGGGTAQMRGESHASERVALTLDFLNDKADVLDLATGLAQLQDTPGEVVELPTLGGGKKRQARLKGAKAGSPVPGQKAHAPTHETAGLAGYPAYDYMAPAGTPAVAPVSGKVVKVSGHDPKQGPTNGPHGPFGWSVYIKGEDGRTYYLTHMGARNVKVGQRVKRGQRIGNVGDYAKWGGADHIHEGVRG